jgi:hypothetical protein
MEVVNQVSNGDQTKSKIVTLFIHYNQEDDLSKIFTVLNEFRTNCGLKFSHHRGQIFVSVRSEHLNELYKRQPFKSSKYSTKTTYTCDEETGTRLTAQKDSFLRMSYDNSNGTGLATFQSRTPQRVHYQLVSRVFKATNTTFDKELYVVVPTNVNLDQQDQQDQHQHQHQHHHQHQQDQQDQQDQEEHQHQDQQEGQSRGGYKTRGRGKARVSNVSTDGSNSWTKVGRRAGPRTVSLPTPSS